MTLSGTRATGFTVSWNNNVLTSYGLYTVYLKVVLGTAPTAITYTPNFSITTLCNSYLTVTTPPNQNYVIKGSTGTLTVVKTESVACMYATTCSLDPTAAALVK